MSGFVNRWVRVELKVAVSGRDEVRGRLLYASDRKLSVAVGLDLVDVPMLLVRRVVALRDAATAEARE